MARKASPGPLEEKWSGPHFLPKTVGLTHFGLEKGQLLIVSHFIVEKILTLGAGTLFTSAMLWHSFRCLRRQKVTQIGDSEAEITKPQLMENICQSLIEVQIRSAFEMTRFLWPSQFENS